MLFLTLPVLESVQISWSLCNLATQLYNKLKIVYCLNAARVYYIFVVVLLIFNEVQSSPGERAMQRQRQAPTRLAFSDGAR